MNALLLLAAGAATTGLEPVVVTATRTALPRDEVIASVDVISRAEIERAVGADLGDLLRARAGVEVARLGGAGQQTSLFLRGTDSNHALVLVDGVRINPGTIGSAAIQNIAPELVERVEIVKGPRSTLYGTDAIGGVINVITRDGGTPHASLEAGYGSHDSRSASFLGGVAGTAGELSVGLNWQDSDGFAVRQGDTHDRGFRNRSATAVASTEAAGVGLALHAWYASGRTEYSDFFIAPVDQDFENSAVSVSAEFEPAGAWHSRLAVGHATDQLEQNQSADFLDTRRWQVDWQNDFELPGRQRLTAGLLWQDEDADAESFELPYSAATETRQLYLQDQVAVGEHRLLLAAGHVHHELFGGHWTWNAETGIALGEATRLVIAAGRAFRAPDATDLYGYGGNPALDPERSKSYEASLRHRTTRGHRWSLTAFRNDIDDLIEFFVAEGENRNVERARIDGVEAEWRYQGERWSGYATLTLSDPRDRGTGERLLRRARENAGAGVARRFGGLELGADLLYAGERRDFGFPAAVWLSSYWLAGLSARVDVSERWTLRARMENLFDEDYELADGYNSMGRSLFVTLRHEFR